MKSLGKTILVIPDSHAKPGISNERYDWLNKLILDRKPNYIVELGDFADMESLSSYDKGKLSGQNRHVGNDIDWAVDARKRLSAGILDRQKQLLKNKHKPWLIKMIALGGNHENRVDKYVNDHPEMLGVLKQDVSDAAKNGWEWHPFMEKTTIEGITFCHYFHNGMGKPLGGVMPARTLTQKLYTSTVSGHSHIWNHYSDVTATGRRINGLVAGCYFGHEEAYARHSNATWDRSVTILHNVVDGDYDIEKISYDRVRNEYGG
jgi:predicted MPP superfamily phosphohydrolase